MKKYTMTLNVTIESGNNVDYERIEEFSEELSDIMKNNKYDDGIKIVDVLIEEIEDDSDDDYIDDDDEEDY